MDIKHRTKSYRAFALLCLGFSMLGFSDEGISQEQQDWWFNVEFIAFKRNILPSNNEDFTQADFTFSEAYSEDIWRTSLYLQNQLHNIELAPCHDPILAYFTDPELDLVLQAPPITHFDKQYDNLITGPSALTCLSKIDTQHKLPFGYHEDAFKYPMPLGLAYDLNVVPQEVFAKEAVFRTHTHLLAKEETLASEVASRIFRQRDIQGLFYTAWRQNVVFGEDNAPYFRIKAGSLLKIEPTISYEDWEKTFFVNQIDETVADDQFFKELTRQLEQEEPVDLFASSQQEVDNTAQQYQQKWEMEGLFKVYLDYVNQIPYLHVDSEFKHYRITLDDTQQTQFETFPMKQRRRIISKQIHYFDHPAFGFVIRLERYVPPEEVIKD